MYRFPNSRMEWVFETVAYGGILCSVIEIIQAWSTLPLYGIPIHFGLSGNPNFWLSKNSIIILPLLGIIVNLLLTQSISHPYRFRYPCHITEQNTSRQYQITRSLLLWMKIEISWIIVFVVWQTIRVANGEIQKLNVLLFLGILLTLLFTIIIHLYQAFNAN